MSGTDYVGRRWACRRADAPKASFPRGFQCFSVNCKILVAELPASCTCSKAAMWRRQETQGIPMVLHCALRGRRLQGPRFVLDAPGPSPATGAESLISLRVLADLLIIVRFPEVDFF